MKKFLCCFVPAAIFAAALFAAGNPVTVSPPERLEGANLAMPQPGESALRVLSPTLLELTRINTKAPDPARVDSWDFVDASGVLTAPAAASFSVSVNGQPAAVQGVGFKRRPLYAPLATRDLRIDNRLYLQLAAPIADGQTVAVTNPDATLWPATAQYSAVADPARLSPAIHVNQEGYMPAFSKKAMVGYYLGSLGEMPMPSQNFSLLDAGTGATVFTGTLTPRADVGFTLSPLPYQNVREADFTGFSTPGTYKLAVPGLGVSQPFAITEGVAMDFARTYALGIYHQRCGSVNAFPFTRFTHDACHTAPADVPSPQSSFTTAWSLVAQANADFASNPRHTAPQLKDEASQLYPFVNKGKIDVSGGHHDAGDYSKYTIDSAQFIHYLVFAADALPGAGALDNLGLPESGDGKSDLLQEAKIEADFLCKMQDADGGFYFLVYPKNRAYESDVLPDHGDPQIVWPKNTSATAAAVAALAQTASSPLFKQQFPNEAAQYLQKAQLGWSFLTAAIAAHGKDGAYQKLTHYGDDFMHDDELAWAACEMFLATGDPAFQTQLIAWYDPSDPATRRWTWWRLFESYGCAARDYAFAARTGRLAASQLDAAYLTKCQNEILAAGGDALTRSTNGAYGSAFDSESKRFRNAGWYFSSERAFDMTVAYQLNPLPDYLTAILTNMNFEGGCNPLNLSYLTGIGARRQREIVHQYAQNDRRVLPPTGIPLGNIQAGFAWIAPYGTELGALTFPNDGAQTAPYAFYDRWGDTFNVNTEFVAVNQSRSLASLAFLAAQTSLKNQAWGSAAASIAAPAGYVPVNTPVTLTWSAPGLDLSAAKVVWEAQGQEPVFNNASCTFTPAAVGTYWIEAEAQWPDGRRVFATTTISVRDTSGAEFAADANTVALFHFNGDYTDASGHGYTLAPAGGVTLTSDNLGWMSQPAGQVARFHALGDTLTATFPDSALMPGTSPTSLTLETRFYPRAYKAYSVGNFDVIALLQNWDTGFEARDGAWNSPHVPTLTAPGSTTLVTSAQWNSLITLNTWHALRFVFDASRVSKCYIDNTLVSSAPVNFNYGRTNTWTLTLGNFDGDLDEVRISNTAR